MIFIDGVEVELARLVRREAVAENGDAFFAHVARL